MIEQESVINMVLISTILLIKGKRQLLSSKSRNNNIVISQLMGNQILSKKSTPTNGFNPEQLEFVKSKFATLKNEDGYLDAGKLETEFRLSKEIAFRAVSVFDLSSDASKQNTKPQVDEYQFLCSLVNICNSSIPKIGQIIFKVICSKSQQSQQVTENDLEKFTRVVLDYNRFKENKKQAPDPKTTNKKKFKNADINKDNALEKEEFSRYCSSDNDYKQWMFNMGFISEEQLNNQSSQSLDSEMNSEIKKHGAKTDADNDKIRAGIYHKNNAQTLTVINNDQETVDEAAGDHYWRLQEEKDQIIDSNPANKNPSQNLSLSHAFGYRGFDSRNNLHYVSKDKIVYPTASLGVVLDLTTKKQDFVIDHNNDITCMDVNENLVASGEMGKKPMIVVWQPEKGKDQTSSTKVHHHLKAELNGSIGNIVLSATNKYLAASCDDQYHTIVIYDLEKLSKANLENNQQQTGVVVAGKSTPEIILAMEFSHDSKILIVAGTTNVFLFCWSIGKLKSIRCIFGEYKKQPALCLCRVEDNQNEWVASGMNSGEICIWQGQNCIKSLSEHTSTVLSIKNRKGKSKGLISGDKKGEIIIWNYDFEPVQRLTVPAFSKNPSVVSLSALNEFILVGTKGCQIIQIKLLLAQKTESTVIMQSHATKQLKALCVGDNHTVFTGGEDKMLFKWEVNDKSKSLLQKECKSYPIESIDYDPKSKKIAIGYINGVVDFVESSDIKKEVASLTEYKNLDGDVLSLVKFAPDGVHLAICISKPNFVVILYDHKKKVCVANMDPQSQVLNLDFSSNSKHIRLNTIALDLLYFDLQHVQKQYEKTKKPVIVKQEEKASIQKWESRSTPMSYSTTAIFGIEKDDKKEIDQKEIDKFVTCCQLDSAEACLIVGDIFSKLKLFNYPCYDQGSIFIAYKGHGGVIASIKFSKDENFVFTIGGQDKTLIVWKYDKQIVQNTFPQALQQAPPDDGAIPDSEEQQAQYSEKVGSSGQNVVTSDPFEGKVFAPSRMTRNHNRDNKLPSGELKIEHVFGVTTSYHKQWVCNQARFSHDGDNIVYPTAALGIEINRKTLNQSFYEGHRQAIISFAINSNRTIVATGEMAPNKIKDPKDNVVSIHVWDIDKKNKLKVMNDFHTVAVVLLAFSPDSTLLFSCGNDSQNSYAIYNWKAGAILYSGPVSTEKVNAIYWKNNFQFATCGNDHLKFWTKNQPIQGRIDQKMFAIIFWKVCYITGGESGNIYSWIKNTDKRAEKRHQKTVNTFAISGELLFSGSEDGKIVMWDMSKNQETMKCLKVIDISQKGMREGEMSVLSIDFSPKNLDTMVVVTGGAEIMTRNKEGKGAIKLVSGHYKNQLWGLATNQDTNIFATAGDDGTIRMWDISLKEMKKVVDLSKQDQTTRIRAIDWAKNNDLIVAADNKSLLHLIPLSSQQIITQDGFKTAISLDKGLGDLRWISDIKVSPDERLIALGGHDQIVEVVSMDNQRLKSNFTFKEFESPITHIDWDKQSGVISVNSKTNQYKLIEVNSKKPKGGSKIEPNEYYQDFQWDTSTKNIAFEVEGMYQGTDYSEIKCVSADRNRKLIAAGYADKVIRLFKYPAYVPNQVHKSYYGHSSTVRNIKFTKNYMISVGGKDRTIIVWKIDGRTSDYDDEKVGGKSEEFQINIQDEIDIPIKALLYNTIQSQPEDDQFAQQIVHVNEFQKTKPWIGSIRQPTYQYPKQTQDPPKVRLELEHVYGYRCKDSRQNVFYGRNEESIIYHAANVLIELNIKSNTQKLNTYHSNEILSIAYHREKNLVLTGQCDQKPIIMLSENMVYKCSWSNAVTEGVLCLSISPKGTKAVCVGLDSEHTVAVIDLSKVNKVIGRPAKSGRNIILKCQWIDENKFITVGINHYWYWSIKNDQLSYLENEEHLRNFVSLAVGYNMILTGSENNTLSKWNETTLDKEIVLKDQFRPQKSTRSVVECIIIRERYVAVGCKDQNIYILKHDLTQVTHINVYERILNSKALFPSKCGSARAMDISKDEKSMIVGTLGGEIYQFRFPTKINDLSPNGNQKVDVRQVMIGHYSPNNKHQNKLCGLCVDNNLSNKRFFTTGDDATVRCWNWEQRRMKSFESLNFGAIKQADQTDRELNDDKEKIGIPLQKDKKLNDFVDDAKGRVVSLSSLKIQGQKYPINQLFVGSKCGTIRIFELSRDTITCKNMFRKATNEISDIKFHNDAMVVGSHDNNIYVYDYNKKGISEKYKALKKHQFPITHLSISQDSCFMQSMCKNSQIFYWDLQTGKPLVNGPDMLRDQMWDNWTSPFGWPVQGIWPKYNNGIKINSVHRSNKNIHGQDYKKYHKQLGLLAVGDNIGKVLIYNYPCVQRGSNAIEGKGHSSEVTNIRWTPDDERVISVGGQDQCIMQWRVIKENKKK